MSSGVQIGSLAVGTSVFADFNGSKTEFIIVHQGKPSSLYDESCNGTWLLKKTYVSQSDVSASVFNPTGAGTSRNCFKDSNIYSTLNGTILNLFGDSIKSAIKTAKIPYTLSDYNGTVKGGSEGLSSKVFLLSGYEVGFTTYKVDSKERLPADGAKLSYFESGEGSSACEKRLFCNSYGSATIWWLRSPDATYHNHVICVKDTGACTMLEYTSTRSIRPAVILDSSALVDTSDYSILGLPSKKHKTLIGGTGYEIKGGRTLVGGTGYSISKGRTLVGGTGYDIAFGIPLGSIAEGTVVYVNENGSPAAFYVAKHNYESELNGDGRTLLVRKDCYDLRNWGKVPTENRLSWEDSTILPWLNSDYLELLDSKIKSVIGSTKYHYSYVYYNTSTGKDLVRNRTRSDAVFLLSMKELGVTSYSDGTTALPIASKLKPAYYNGSAVDQWTRTPTKGVYTNAEIVTKVLNAISSTKRVSDTAGARPALSLPAETMVNQGTYLITG